MTNPLGFEIFAKDKASETFETLTNRIKAANKTTAEWKVGAIAGAAGVGAAVYEFGKQSVDAYKEAEHAQLALSEAYRKFPALADVGLDKLKELAEETQKKTKFDHNAAMEAEATLATFHLTGKQIEDMLPLVADYAAKTGKDLPEAAKLLGRATLGSARALKDVGINFDAAALKSRNLGIEQVKGASGASDMSGALDLLHAKGIPVNYIIDAMRKQVGGFAEHEAKDAADKTIMMQHNYDDLKEKVGMELVPALSTLLSIGVQITDWMSHHATVVKILLVVLGTYIAVSKASALIMSLQDVTLKGLIEEHNIYKASLVVGGAVQGAYNGVVEFGSGLLTGAREAVKGMTAAEMAQSVATRGLTGITWLLNAAWDASPIGVVTLLLAGLTAGIIYAYKHSQTFRTIVNDTWHAVASGAQWMWGTVLRPTFKFIMDYWMTTAGAIIHGAAAAFGWVPGLGGKLKGAARAFDHFRDDVNNSLSGINPRHVSVGVTFAAGSKLAYDARHQGMATGGPVPMEPGASPLRDSVVRALMPGEFVVRRDGSNLADALAYYGAGMAGGGPVVSGRFPTHAQIVSAEMGGILGAARSLGSLLLGTGGGSGSGASRWTATALQALALLGQPSALLGAVLRRINLESGGNPNAINLWDSNAKAGHPSMGLMQTIMGTFLAYAGPFRGLGITNPLANIYAGLNYALHRYGSIGAIDPLVRPTGYDSGGLLMPGYTLAYNGTGHPETIVPPGAGRSGGAVVVQLVLDRKVVQQWLVEEGRSTRQGLLKERRSLNNARLGFDT